MITKQCTHCGELKPADSNHFYRSKMFDDGLHNVCRSCQSVIDVDRDFRKVKRMYGVYTLERDYIEEMTKQ